MFTHVLRAVILLGVIGWYSTGVWKMIDGYFKDRFNKYLREEFTKNPRMKKDLDAQRIKNDGVDKIVETIPSVIKTDNKKIIVNDNYENNNDVDFLHSTELDNGNEVRDEVKSSENYNNIEMSHYSASQMRKSPTTNEPNNRPSTVDKLNKVKKKVKTKKSTGQHSFVTEKKISVDNDFSEFEYDDYNRKSQEREPGSINIVDLPFKPKADLGHRDTVNEDEYCPVNFDYHEENCKDSREWP